MKTTVNHIIARVNGSMFLRPWESPGYIHLPCLDEGVTLRLRKLSVLPNQAIHGNSNRFRTDFPSANSLPDTHKS